MCGYFRIGFIDFILKRKCLLEDINLLSPKWWEEWWINTKIYSVTKKMKKSCSAICGKYKKFEKPKI